MSFTWRCRWATAVARSRASGSDGPSRRRPSRPPPPQRAGQPRRDRQDVPDRGGAAGPGRDRQGERARARPAGARHGLLRRRPRALHDGQHPRGAALPLGRAALALGRRGGPGGGQERHLAGPHPPGRGAAAPPVRAARGGGGRGPPPAERLARPVATPATKGGWYREWRLVSLDGSCLDVADTAENEAAFGRPGPGRGESGFPQVRFVALVENGTHVLFGARPGGFAEGETTLAHDVLPALGPGMLCLADRQFFGHALWREAAATGADLLWRVKRNLRLPRETVLADGSFLSTIYPSEKDRRHKAAGCGWSSTGWRAGAAPG